MTQPVSSGRVSSTLMRSRIAAQIQADQQELFRLQNQLSTGLRILLPSDDPSAAQRAMVLQRTIERKEQSQTNIGGAVASLTTAEGSLNQVGQKLSELKAEALGVAGSITTEEERQGVIQLIDEMIELMVTTGNTVYTENHLFSGNESSRLPYVRNEGYVEYLGNEGNTQTFIDIGRLFDASIPGDEVFGGLSEPSRGDADLNPQLNSKTRLSQINGGSGLSQDGAIEITFRPTNPLEPTTSSTIDLGQASTFDDVIRLIEKGAPEGSELSVQISAGGLRLSTDQGTILVNEVAEGKTALELGILQPDVSLATIQGGDLNPTLLETTRLDDLVGIKSRGVLALPGDNNDLRITATQNGSQYNNLTVEIVGGATVGNESASYSAGTNTLTVTISPGETDAEAVAAAINATGVFTAETDGRDALSLDQLGQGGVALGTYTGATDNGGVNGTLDLASGLQVVNGGDPFVIDTSGAETIEDLLNLFNRPEYGLQASINEDQSGIDVRSRRSGAQFTIGENGGSTASDLGLRTYDNDTLLADMNRGAGVIQEGAANRLEISVTDGGATTDYTIDLTGVASVGDLRAAINTQTGGNVTATLAISGNGLRLEGTTAAVPGIPASGTVPLGGDTLTVTADAPGTAGNQAFTIEVVDSGSGGLTSNVIGNAITVDLGGSAPDTAAIASSVSTELAGFSVSSSGTSNVTGPVTQQSFNTINGTNTNTAGATAIAVDGDAAERLGFFEAGQGPATASGPDILTSADTNPQEVDSAFTTLMRLRDALENNDTVAIGRETERLEDDLDRVTLARAEAGTRLQTLEAYQTRLEDEEVELRRALSDEIDADWVDVVSEYTNKQYALQAAMRTSGSILSLSILDYI